mgnify:CR=1 FL=1|tara:strand:+ start:1729 stop:2577 length:849 start_codon:yes stop_codon:yes gene_type:complete
MDLVQLFYDLLPSIPPESLRDWAFFVILIPAIARVVMLSTLYGKFNEIFPKKKVRAAKLLVKLEIPGMKKFVRHQSAIILLPGVISLPILLYSGLDTVHWDDLPSQTATVATIGLVVWVVYGLANSLELMHQMEKILNELGDIIHKIKLPINETQLVDNLSQTSIVALEVLVKIRKSLSSTKKWASSSMPTTIEKNILPFLGSLGEAITSLFDEYTKKAKEIVQDLVNEQVEVISEKFNNFLDRQFASYIIWDPKRTVRMILISASPSLWLALVAWHSGVGF